MLKNIPAALVSGFVLLLFSVVTVMLTYLLFVGVKIELNEPLLALFSMIFGALSRDVGTVVQYVLGSSLGSKTKDDALMKDLK